MQDFFDLIRKTLESSLAECKTVDDLIESMLNNIDVFYTLLKNEPIYSILWAGLQANPVLLRDDADDSRRNAKIIEEKIQSIMGDVQNEGAFEACFLLVHMTGSTIRLALTMPREEANLVVSEFKGLVVLRLKALHVV